MRYFLIFYVSLLWVSPAFALSFHAPKSQYEKRGFERARKDLAAIKKINDEFADNKSKKKILSEAEIEKEKIQRQVFEEDAIKAVIAAYGIKPKHETGALYLGTLSGTKAVRWDPILSERQNRDAKNAAGETVHLHHPPSSALTWSNGQITVSQKSFFYTAKNPGEITFFATPALLASIIIHETVHYEQYTNPKDASMSLFSMEEESYSTQMNAGSVIGLSNDEENLINHAMITELKWVKAHPNASPFDIPESLSGGSSPAEDDIEKTKTEAETSFLETWKKQVQPVLDAPRSGNPQNSRGIPIVPDPLQEAIGKWTDTACHYITPPTYEDIPSDSNSDLEPGTPIRMPDQSFYNNMAEVAKDNDRIAAAKAAQDQEDRRYLLDHLVVMEQSNMERLKEENQSLTSCQEDMLDLFLQADGPIDAQWMLKELDEKKREEIDKDRDMLDTLVHALIRGIPIAAAAIVRGISAPFIAVGNSVTVISPDNSGGSGGSGGGENNGGSHVQYHAGLADSQLRGIASGSMSFDGGM